MPINNDLTPVQLPMVLKFDQVPVTNYINNLESLNIELIDGPTREQAQKIAWHMTKATWADTPSETAFENATPKEASLNLQDVLNFRALPTPMECLGFTFKISGIDTQTVTHLIRHRAFSFSAQCTGDRSQRDDEAVVPHAIINSPEYYERYKKLVQDSKQLYADMVDTKDISIMDARHILPKCLSTFYWARGNIRDVMAFIKTRIDKQIQPSEDNLVAYYMWLELVRAYPMIVDCIDIHTPARYYISTARTGTGTNLYWPDEDSDEFEYNEMDFLYQSKRDDLNGTHGGRNTFVEKIAEVDAEIQSLREMAYERYDFLRK